MRLTEPFIKFSYVLWLISKGANNIRVSVDGAEPEHEILTQRLVSQGYKRKALTDSKVNWTGQFIKNGIEIIVVSRPGIDVIAKFSDGKVLVAECKGEPTPKGVKSGIDLTNFYTALGQLIVTADDNGILPSNLSLVLPNTPRLRDIVTRTAQNDRFKKLGIVLMLVDKSGEVMEITSDI